MSDLIERQAAIKSIENLQDCYNGFSGTYDKACIIGVLEEVPSAQPETCAYWDRESNFCALHRPSAQPERKKGHYIGEADGYADGELVCDIWSCSECGCYFEDWDEKPTYNFCPNCGADMRGEKDE